MDRAVFTGSVVSWGAVQGSKNKDQVGLCLIGRVRILEVVQSSSRLLKLK